MSYYHQMQWHTTDIQAELDGLTERGFTVDPNSGELLSHNGNIFGEFIKANYKICYGPDGNFYKYRKGFYQLYPLNAFKKFLRKVLQTPRPHIWKSCLEREYLEVLYRELLVKKPFNSRKELLNLSNGMYDTNKCRMLKHKRKYHSTIRIPIEFDAGADCPKFKRYLEQVFERDPERIRLAQEWYGYCLSTDVSAQKALILFGSGANGKGVFTSILSELVGRENICNIALGELGRSFSRVRLYNKTVNISSENEITGKGLNTSYFKAIVGGDEIDAEEKNKPGFSFRPTVKLVFAVNDLPRTLDRSEGYFRRLAILHFSTFIREEDRDPYLIEKLHKELPGILNWAIEGLERLRGNDFKFSPCQSSDDMLKKYKEEQRPVMQFFREKIVAKDDAKVKNSDVLHSFHEWARFNGYINFSKISARSFWNEIEAICRELGIGTQNKHSGNERFHTGFMLVQSQFTTPTPDELDELDDLQD